MNELSKEAVGLANAIGDMIAEPCTYGTGDRWRDCPYAVTARDIRKRGAQLIAPR